MPGRSKATGVVQRNGDNRGRLSSGGVPAISEGHGEPRTKQELQGSRVTDVAG